MGRAAWGRRPPLTRERRNPAQPPWPHRSTAGRRAARGIGGEAGPADGGRDGLGARSPSIPAVGVGSTTLPRKTPLRAAQRVGFSRSTAKMGVSARSGPIWSETGHRAGDNT